MELLLSLESYLGLSSATVMDIKWEQNWKGASPMVVTLLGMVMETKPVRAKAEFPIVVTLLGIVIDVKLEQFSYLQPVITQYFASNKSEIWS